MSVADAIFVPCRTSIAYSCANHSRSGSLDSNAPGIGPRWKHLLQVTILLLRRFWYKQDSRIWTVCSMNAVLSERFVKRSVRPAALDGSAGRGAC